MRRDKRWNPYIKGVWCGECWTYWPGLNTNDVCPDGCISSLHPSVRHIEAVRL